MQKYNPQKIEQKWQKEWEKEGFFKAKDFSKNPKLYILVEFPYPSGDGLHVGHCRSYVALDVVARKKRMEGFNVLFPMGWDAFGLPTENYAIKTGIHPALVTKKNSAYFKKQERGLGLSFDWSREINTTDPNYYRWTQWIFVKLFKKGLAYKAKMPINWCPGCKIGLANEEVVDAKCERCGKKVEKREKEQWMLKITKYADRLIKDLDLVDFPGKVKILQKEWIGKSKGVQFEIPIYYGKESKPLLEKLEVFTTRIDTVFGMTYVVISTDHPLVSEIIMPEQKKEVEKYIKEAKHKLELEKLVTEKEKTGVFSGSYALNIFNNQKIPVYISEYVLMGYGTGAIMAVPAHDERDYIFAKKHKIAAEQVITPDLNGYNQTKKALNILKNIYQEAKKKDIKFWLLGGLAHSFHTGLIYRKHSDLDLIVKNTSEQERFLELLKKIGFEKIGEKKLSDKLVNLIFKNKEGIEVDIGPHVKEFGIIDSDFGEDEKELEGVKCLVMSKRYLKNFKEYLISKRNEEKDKIDLKMLEVGAFIEDGYLIRSGQFSGLKSTEAREKMTKWLEEKKMGRKAVYYKLRDWIFSRQRYWGEPIPIIYCRKCWEIRNSKSEIRNLKLGYDYTIINGQEYMIIPIPEKDLPVELPKVKEYKPTDKGESPLAKVENWLNVACPECGGAGRRETDVMPNWAGSNWYFLRYCDPKNNKNLADQKLLKYWMPVDWYNGGMEHTTLHLLYSRFIYKFLWDIGAVPKSIGPEPYKKRTSHGMVLGEGGIKMSKSKGNVINPDDVVKQYGADTMRVYEMFMGPFDQMIPWDTKGVKGVRRFLEKIWQLSQKVNQKTKTENKDLPRLIHKTTKKVGEDIEAMKFNTAVSTLMILVNEMAKEKEISLNYYSLFLILLSPFAPHLAEELWNQLGNKKSIFLEKWPKYDSKLLGEEKITLVVQINGKVRDKIETDANISQKEAEKIALSSEKTKKWLGGKQIKKVVFVPNKLINIVI